MCLSSKISPNKESSKRKSDCRRNYDKRERSNYKPARRTLRTPSFISKASSAKTVGLQEFTDSFKRWRLAVLMYLLPEKAEPGRNWWHAPSILTARAKKNHL